MIEARALALTFTVLLVVTACGSPAVAANDGPRFSIVQAQSASVGLNGRLPMRFTRSPASAETSLHIEEPFESFFKF
jgi:hypothetical protein